MDSPIHSTSTNCFRPSPPQAHQWFLIAKPFEFQSNFSFLFALFPIHYICWIQNIKNLPSLDWLIRLNYIWQKSVQCNSKLIKTYIRILKTLWEVYFHTPRCKLLTKISLSTYCYFIHQIVMGIYNMASEIKIKDCKVFWMLPDDLRSYSINISIKQFLVTFSVKKLRLFWPQKNQFE